MRIEFWQPAGTYEVPGKGEFQEQYAPHAFDRLIGQDAPFKVNNTERGTVTVIAVKVDEDGRGATWTVDIPDVAGDLAAHPVPGLSAGFREDQGMSFTIPPAIPERWWE